MQYFLEQVQATIAGQVKSILQVGQEPIVQLANPKFGSDLAIPCFAYAKELEQNPQAIATIVAEKLQHGAIERTDAVGGFVNIWLSPVALMQYLGEDLLRADEQKIRYGEYRMDEKQTVIVEFPSPNMAKPFGVGHLRPANQGWAIRKLMQAVGYDVVTDNHLGDWGTPFGKWAVGLQRFGSEEALAKKGVYELARVYIKMTAELKYEAEHGKHELADEVQEWLLKLENGDETARNLSKRFNQISLDHIHKVQGRLKISTDEELGESFYIPEGKRMVQELVEKGLAEQQEDGAVIVRLDEYGIETPMLIQKSNGTALYATSDIATIRYRWQRWKPAKVIHMVGEEQRFYFLQLFAFAKKTGYDQMEMLHLSWGMIDQLNEDGSRSKMSSRKGTILLEELIDKAEARARQNAAESGVELNEEDISRIAIGAIKFTDFAADRRTGILFDWNRMFSLQGFSGPYVQYAGVRVKSILTKLGENDSIPAVDDYDWLAERELLLHLHTYPLVVKEAAQNYEPHKIAAFAYELARLLNRYYEQTSIADSPPELQLKRLWLLGEIRQVHEHALGLLGIEVPSKM